jgi:hypothetical protein
VSKNKEPSLTLEDSVAKAIKKLIEDFDNTAETDDPQEARRNIVRSIILSYSPLWIRSPWYEGLNYHPISQRITQPDEGERERQLARRVEMGITLPCEKAEPARGGFRLALVSIQAQVEEGDPYDLQRYYEGRNGCYFSSPAIDGKSPERDSTYRLITKLFSQVLCQTRLFGAPARPLPRQPIEEEQEAGAYQEVVDYYGEPEFEDDRMYEEEE